MTTRLCLGNNNRRKNKLIFTKHTLRITDSHMRCEIVTIMKSHNYHLQMMMIEMKGEDVHH